MNVTEVMQEFGRGISQTATLSEAAVKMRDELTDFLPVMNGTKLVGVVTDRDIVTRGVVSGRDSSEIRVSEVMTLYIDTVSCEAELSEVARRMQENQLRRIFVVDPTGKYIGVVSWEHLWSQSDVHATPLQA